MHQKISAATEQWRPRLLSMPLRLIDSWTAKQRNINDSISYLLQKKDPLLFLPMCSLALLRARREMIVFEIRWSSFLAVSNSWIRTRCKASYTPISHVPLHDSLIHHDRQFFPCFSSSDRKLQVVSRMLRTMLWMSVDKLFVCQRKRDEKSNCAFEKYQNRWMEALFSTQSVGSKSQCIAPDSFRSVT